MPPRRAAASPSFLNNDNDDDDHPQRIDLANDVDEDMENGLGNGPDFIDFSDHDDASDNEVQIRPARAARPVGNVLGESRSQGERVHGEFQYER